MPLVFAGVVSHGPGITGRYEQADKELREALYQNFYRLGAELKEARPDVLIVVAAEHFANFFMDNMPAYAMGMAEYYEGPIEDEQWLGIKRRKIPGNAELSGLIVEKLLRHFDLAYSQEWQFDHGIMVPLNFLTPEYNVPIIPVNINCQGPPLTPLARAYDFGRELGRICAALPERIAIIGTGGISHWPATPDSGRINEPWDREFLERWLCNDRAALTSYSDEEIYLAAGQGGFEIRTFIAVSGATEGCTGELYFYAPIPIFAVGCTVARVNLPH